MPKIKVVLENESGNRLLCCGDLLYQEGEPHIRLTQDENPSLRVRQIKLLVDADTIARCEEKFFDFECLGDHDGVINRPGAF